MFGLPQNMVCSRGSLHQDSVSEKCCNTSKMCSTPFQFNLILSGTKIPKWFNHQSVGSSISFSVGSKSLTFAYYVAFKIKLKDIVASQSERFFVLSTFSSKVIKNGSLQVNFF